MDNKKIENLTYQVYDDHAVVAECDTNVTSAVVLTEVEGKPVTEIGSSAFAWCKSLESITIPDSVTEIGSYAFAGCTSLKEITVPNSVTEIGDFAFYGCESLESITIPNSVTEIGECAFYSSTSLESVTMPDNIQKISETAFQNCPNIQRVNFSQDLVDRPDSNQIFNQMVDSGLRTYEVVFQKPTL